MEAEMFATGQVHSKSMQRFAPAIVAKPTTRAAGTPVAEMPQALRRVASISRIGRNETIFFDGDEATAYFRVVSGAVRLCKVLPDGRRHLVDFLFAGDFFGFAVGEEYDCAAEAITDAVVTRYPRSQVESIARTDIDACNALRGCASAALTAAHARSVLLGRLSAVERVASFLVRLTERIGGNEHVVLPMSRADIADYLGLTIETVSRVITQLKNRGLIRLADTYDLQLRDLDGLTELAEGAQEAA